MALEDQQDPIAVLKSLGVGMGEGMDGAEGAQPQGQMPAALMQLAKLLRLPGMTDSQFEDLRRFDKMTRDRGDTAAKLKQRLIHEGMSPAEADKRVAPLRKMPPKGSPEESYMMKQEDFGRMKRGGDPGYMPEGGGGAAAPRQAPGGSVRGKDSAKPPIDQAPPSTEQELQDVQKQLGGGDKGYQWQGTDQPTAQDLQYLQQNPAAVQEFVGRFHGGR